MIAVCSLEDVCGMCWCSRAADEVCLFFVRVSLGQRVQGVWAGTRQGRSVEREWLRNARGPCAGDWMCRGAALLLPNNTRALNTVSRLVVLKQLRSGYWENAPLSVVCDKP